MVTTGNVLYSKPLKPRVRIYAFNDGTYSSPLYSYNPFTATPSTPNKPSGLTFSTSTTNVGDFSITIENNTDTIDPEIFLKGNRVFIDCSKDGTTFQPAFKGLVRGQEHDVFAPAGKNLTITGYSYLIRYNERILNKIKESAKIAPGGENDPYDRTDPNMFTNDVVFNLVDTNAYYISGIDDFQLYGIIKHNNIFSSPVNNWLPIINAELTTVNEALSRTLEYSNALIMVNFANDELVLYNPEQTTSDTQTFMITREANKNADDADITMYPTQPYKYTIGYDFPDSANKLIISYKDPRTNVNEPIVDIPDCPDTTIPGQEPAIFGKAEANFSSGGDWFSEGDCRVRATVFVAETSLFKNFRTVCECQGNVSTHRMRARIHSWSAGAVGATVGSDMILYRNSDTAQSLPSASTLQFQLGLPEGVNGPALTPGTTYWLSLRDLDAASISTRVGWNYLTSRVSGYGDALTTCASFPTGWTIGNDGPGSKYVIEYATDSTTIPGCAGFTEVEVNYDQLVTARDTNGMKKIGLVERPITTLPPGIHTQQTINEYLFAKLYKSSKPRFDFSYPALTMPNKMPKAGDLVYHVDKFLKIGTKTTPIQTGIISDISYDFGADQNQLLGLRRLSLNTTGIRRGYY